MARHAPFTRSQDGRGRSSWEPLAGTCLPAVFGTKADESNYRAGERWTHFEEKVGLVILDESILHYDGQHHCRLGTKRKPSMH